MATTGRQTKGARKGPPEPTAARRTPAWTGARGSPTYSPSPASPRQHPTQAPPIQNSFPPLAQINGARQDNPRDRVLQALSGLTGTTVTLQTKTSQRYEGVVGSTSEGDTAGVTLKDVKDITAPGAPLKDQLFIASAIIDSYTSGPADAKPANGDSFRTDADISQNKGVGRERDLQAWVASEDTIITAGNLVDDDDTFGPGAIGNGNTWDQFSANETLFGVKASFDEDVYTTKLDRSAPDFKERERKAQRIANEIIGAATSNPHIAEERGFNVDDSGVNEEDKYGAVVRGQNAYVPPGARKTGAGSENVVTSTKGDVPKVSVNGPDGTSVAAQAQSPHSSKEQSPAPPGSGSVSTPTDKPPADPLPAFIAFVTDERRRLTQKRQALVKSEMDKRMAELVKFSKDFKLNKPIPEDLVPILAKDQEKQRAIKEKASKDAASSQARAIGASNPTTASRGLAVAGAKNSDSSRKPITQTLGSKIASNTAQASITAANAQKMASAAAASAAAAAAAATTAAAKPAEGTTSKKISMVIQTIPPFRGKDKSKQDSNAITTTSSTPVTANGPLTNTNQNTTNNNASRNSASPAIVPASPNTIANRLNVNASSFRPNPKANAFNPVPSTKAHAPAAASMSSPKTNKPDSAPTTPNPFFGRPIKKGPPVHIKDDFNPFKHNKVVDAAQVATLWPYSGKRYMQLFPTPQYQPAQHPAHMAPPVPPPMPPPSHEEDSAARGYVYAYPPYGYPAQHMMQGMPPPGPPGAYMPGPYMQPMPYPPGMPPPNAMYSPAMGQMPPPQGYMPPPPGAYPPPPNGAGPRPSMPPTPIQANAHPYYHQSPQLQHAYPMMMPPPPNIPPHGYEGGPPPVQMGGHS